MIGQLVLAVCADDGTYRLVFELEAGFVVYKAFRFNELWTVKYWKGASVASIARRWKTNVPFQPEDWMLTRAKDRILYATLRMADLVGSSDASQTVT